MSDKPHDPNSLADELDRVLPPGQSTQAASPNDPLVEAAARLSAIPRPSLSPEASARIHAALMTAQPAAPPPRSLTRRFIRQSAPMRAAVAAILLIVLASGAIFAAKIGLDLLNPPTATITSLPPSATVTPLPSTATLTSTNTSTPIPPPPVQLLATEEALSATQTSLPTTVVPTATASSTSTLTATATSTLMIPAPTFTPDPTLPVTIVVEGPIQSINGNIIVIFDLTIIVNPSDPILTTLQVGDVVRVEGNLADDGATIMAVRVTVIRNTPIPNPNIPNSNVEVNPSTGQTWTDPGDCSNPPPPWAPATGWRHRCQGAPSPGNSGENGNGNGEGNGMGNGMGD